MPIVNPRSAVHTLSESRSEAHTTAMSLPAVASKTGAMSRILELLGPDPQAAAFAKVLLGRDGQDGLTRLDPPQLAELTREALEFIARKPKAQHKVRMRNLEAAADGEALSLLEISNDDMPFLVDSILGELQARGLGVLALLHPILKTERNGAGRLNKIIGSGDQDWDDGHQESYIAVLLNAVPPAMGKEIVAAIS